MPATDVLGATEPIGRSADTAVDLQTRSRVRPSSVRAATNRRTAGPGQPTAPRGSTRRRGLRRARCRRLPQRAHARRSRDTGAPGGGAAPRVRPGRERDGVSSSSTTLRAVSLRRGGLRPRGARAGVAPTSGDDGISQEYRTRPRQGGTRSQPSCWRSYSWPACSPRSTDLHAGLDACLVARAGLLCLRGRRLAHRHHAAACRPGLVGDHPGSRRHGHPRTPGGRGRRWHRPWSSPDPPAAAARAVGPPGTSDGTADRRLALDGASCTTSVRHSDRRALWSGLGADTRAADPAIGTNGGIVHRCAAGGAT